ncbi:hypothetical protein BGZ54_007876, partial [Gamsiella multidivaricata]
PPSSSDMVEHIELEHLQEGRQSDQKYQQQGFSHGHHSDSVGSTYSSEKAVEDLSLSRWTTTQSPATHSGASSTDKRTLHTAQEMIRLERIRASVHAFLNQRFSVHEYTVPRLFIVLPDDEIDVDTSGEYAETAPTAVTADGTTADADGTAAGASSFPTSSRHRLYFLCECSPSFTLPLGSGLNHLHIAKHAGYPIDPARQDEFFQWYGDMILTLLYFLKYGDDLTENPSAASPPVSTQNRRQQPGQVQQQPNTLYSKDAGLRSVTRISNLRRSDLPDSIAQGIENKFDRMIEYLERLRTASTETIDRAEEADDGRGSAEEEKAFQGLVSLSDLHRLYSFLGIADIHKRAQSGQLGNLYRISNVESQVSWVCVYHYRWTFLEKNIDEFERWVVTRRGLFDKQSGSVSITLFSGAHMRTFCSWITNKVAPSLVEAHIKLGWHFGKKDLWKLAKTLASSTVTVLSLDGGLYAEHSKYRVLHKKYDPILHLLTYGQLHSLEISRFPSLFSRLSARTTKALSIRRLEFGPGMEVNPKDRRVFSNFIASCTSLQELILPELNISDPQMQAIVSGIRTVTSLSMLDLSKSRLNDGAAIILAQGLFKTNICNLDLSGNERLTDAGVARVIRAIGPRLTSLKMAQTGFGDVAAAALAKSMDGISITSTLQDQLNLQQRLDIAAISAGHRPGLRLAVDNPLFAMTPRPRPEVREKTHSKGHLVYLDIEDNQCTVQGFRSLASIKSRLYFVYLNLSGSKELQDMECAQILERVASSAMVTLRLAGTGFSDQSAEALSKALLSRFPNNHEGHSRIPVSCQLEEIDLRACPISSEGLLALCRALAQTRTSSCLRTMDIGHCRQVHDHAMQQLLRALVIPNGSTWAPTIPGRRRPSRVDLGSQSLTAIGSARGNMNSSWGPQDFQDDRGDSGGRDGSRAGIFGRQGSRCQLVRSDSDPTPHSTIFTGGDTTVYIDSAGQFSLMPPRMPLQPPMGFFTNLRQLDLNSTRVGDGTAWLLAQALLQSWTMIRSLTILDAADMTVQGMCLIIDALCGNSTVHDFGIGKSGAILQSDLDLFGAGLVNLMEMNKRIRSLTTLGAPLGSLAKGLLLNQSLHSVYLIRSRGQFEDLQLMGQALSLTRSLLVFWMGGSDESLLGPLNQGSDEQQQPIQGISDSPSTSAPSSQRAQFQQHQQQQEEQQHENMYRNFHLLHNQNDDQQHHPERYHHHLHGAQHSQSLSKSIESVLKKTFGFQPKQSKGKQQASAEGDHTAESSTPLSPPPHNLRPLPNANPTSGANIASTGRAAITGGNAATASGPWTRHPIIEGIRRNYSLIKVVLDTSTLSPAAAAAAAAAATGANPTWHNSQAGNAQGVTQQQELVQQYQLQQQQQLQKKIMVNRKLLRERGRVGWEELKLLGVDDDVIREVCQDTRQL